MTDPIRIIAWGNRGRRDDGVALVLAERLQAQFAGDPHVCVQEYHQLGPEVAADLDRCRLAIFVDARVGEADRPDVCVEPVAPVEVAALGTHHCSPPVLLALAASMRFKVPPACLVTIRGYDMDFGDTLSPAAVAGVDEAERVVNELVASARAAHTCLGGQHA